MSIKLQSADTENKTETSFSSSLFGSLYQNQVSHKTDRQDADREEMGAPMANWSDNSLVQQLIGLNKAIT